MKRKSAHNLPSGIDPHRLALGIQQPWAELILRGVKTLEIRNLHTQVRGPIYLYASRRYSSLPAAQAAAERFGVNDEELPRGVLVGSVQLVDSQPAVLSDELASCVPADLLPGRFAWQLTQPERFLAPVSVRFLPYGVWFYPFRRHHQNEGK